MMVRVVSGVVALLLVLGVLLWGGQLGVEVLVPIVMVVCAVEYGAMAFPTWRMGGTAWVLIGSGSLYASLLYGDRRAWVTISLFGIVLGSQLLVLFRAGSDTNQAADRVGRLLMGIFWLALFVFAPFLREASLGWLLMALVIAWSSDTGAYFSGRAFGKRKLYEAVSPNKTWEGFWGGLAACLCSVFVMNYAMSFELRVLDCVLISLLAGTMSVLGDLVESLVKRGFGVKDSGRIMPGHGGLLDRVDSLLFVFPTLYGYVWLIQKGV